MTCCSFPNARGSVPIRCLADDAADSQHHDQRRLSPPTWTPNLPKAFDGDCRSQDRWHPGSCTASSQRKPKRRWSGGSKKTPASISFGAAIGTDHDAVARTAALVEAGVDVLVSISHTATPTMPSGRRPDESGLPQRRHHRRQRHRPGVGHKTSSPPIAGAVQVGSVGRAVCVPHASLLVSGVPQLTAVNDCADLRDAGGERVPVVPTAASRTSGDIAKALGAGANVS
ncbi:MAG: IMP dehydrogenase [Acidimicrobiales bacterium]